MLQGRRSGGETGEDVARQGREEGGGSGTVREEGRRAPAVQPAAGEGGLEGRRRPGEREWKRRGSGRRSRGDEVWRERMVEGGVGKRAKKFDIRVLRLAVDIENEVQKIMDPAKLNIE